MAYGGDVGSVDVFLTKWNPVTGMRDTVAMGTDSLGGMAMSWTKFSLPLMYMSGENPDTAQIILSSSGKNPVTGSYLYIDNLAFAGSVAGINENKLSTEIKLFPNPSANQLLISLNNSTEGKGQVEIYDVQGKKLTSLANIDFTSTTAIDIADLSPGAYCIKLNTSAGIISKKFIKQ